MIRVVSVGGGLFGKRIVGWREKRVCTNAVFVYGFMGMALYNGI